MFVKFSKMSNLNPTETSCCRRCQSDSGTCCVSHRKLMHWLNPTNHPHHSPYIMSSRWTVSTYCTWNDIRRAFFLPIILFFFLVGHLEKLHGYCCVVCRSFTVWSMSHMLFYHLACVTVHTCVLGCSLKPSTIWVYALFHLVICMLTKHTTRLCGSK